MELYVKVLEFLRDYTYLYIQNRDHTIQPIAASFFKLYKSRVQKTLRLTIKSLDEPAIISLAYLQELATLL